MSSCKLKHVILIPFNFDFPFEVEYNFGSNPLHSNSGIFNFQA